MNNFGTLYVFELKKIFMRKIVWITMIVMVAIALFMGFGETTSVKTYVSDGKEVEISGYEVIQKSKENALTITGEKLDEALLSEVKAAYEGMYRTTYADGKSVATSSISQEDSLEVVQKRIKEQERLSNIYRYVYRITGDYNAIHVIDEEGLYTARRDYIQEEMDGQKLSEGEVAYWQEKEEEIARPFVYGYADGWELVIGELYSLNIMLLMAITICLSTVFSEEHVRKTDQLILCSRYGKKTLYIAKVLAGITFGLSCAVIMFLASFLPTLLIYGTEGFDVTLQIYAPMAGWNITMGQAVVLLTAVYLVIAVFYSVITMFLSEALRNSVAVMGLMTGGMIFSMVFSVPYKYRILSQIYELLPTLMMGLWEFTDYRLIKMGGVYFTNLQIAPILYTICGMLLVIVGKHIYKNYQVSGR